MVRLLATVFGVALLSSSTFAAPTRGMHRRTMPEDKPTTGMMQKPPMMSESPMSKPPMMMEPSVPEATMKEPPMSKPPMKDSPPKSSMMKDEPPKSMMMEGEPPKPSGMAGEPPKSTGMVEPPKPTSSMVDKPPKGNPMMDKPKGSSPMPEPPMSQPPMNKSPQPTPSYGSGSNPWSPTYDDCVQKCIADYGAPKKSTWTPPPKESRKPDAKPTHTVMVAPVDGVPRFLPFALNATIGDTVRFIWAGKKEHSVTMSSSLSVCSKSQAADAFDSDLLSGKDGEKTFDVEVKSDQPMWFFCKFGDHCSKGMFGGINLKSAFGDTKSVGAMMNKWVQANPDLQAAWTYAQNRTTGTPAEKWGNSISVGDIPEDKHADLAQNILWTRVNLAANPGMQEMGSAQTPDNSPLQLLGDLSTLLTESNAPHVVQEPASSTGSVPIPTESKTGGALPAYSSAVVVSILVLFASALLM